MTIQQGDRVFARAMDGERLERKAWTGVVMGSDFEVVWVVRPEEWDKAASEGREPDAVPWPAEDVALH